MKKQALMWIATGLAVLAATPNYGWAQATPTTPSATDIGPGGSYQYVGTAPDGGKLVKLTPNTTATNGTPAPARAHVPCSTRTDSMVNPVSGQGCVTCESQGMDPNPNGHGCMKKQAAATPPPATPAPAAGAADDKDKEKAAAPTPPPANPPTPTDVATNVPTVNTKCDFLTTKAVGDVCQCVNPAWKLDPTGLACAPPALTPTSSAETETSPPAADGPQCNPITAHRDGNVCACNKWNQQLDPTGLNCVYPGGTPTPPPAANPGPTQQVVDICANTGNCPNGNQQQDNYGDRGTGGNTNCSPCINGNGNMQARNQGTYRRNCGGCGNNGNGPGNGNGQYAGNGQGNCGGCGNNGNGPGNGNGQYVGNGQGNCGGCGNNGNGPGNGNGQYVGNGQGNCGGCGNNGNGPGSGNGQYAGNGQGNCGGCDNSGNGQGSGCTFRCGQQTRLPIVSDGNRACLLVSRADNDGGDGRMVIACGNSQKVTMETHSGRETQRWTVVYDRSVLSDDLQRQCAEISKMNRSITWAGIDASSCKRIAMSGGQPYCTSSGSSSSSYYSEDDDGSGRAGFGQDVHRVGRDIASFGPVHVVGTTVKSGLCNTAFALHKFFSGNPNVHDNCNVHLEGDPQAIADADKMSGQELKDAIMAAHPEYKGTADEATILSSKRKVLQQVFVDDDAAVQAYESHAAN